MSPNTIDILLQLGTALAAGLIIGAERQQEPNDSTFAGVRTFPLYALAGALGALVGTWLLVALAIGVAMLVGLAYYRLSQSQSRLGMSTEVAALVTFGLGALCTTRDLGIPLGERLLVVAAGAVATLALLTVKKPLHGLIARVSEQDVYATVKLLVLSVIVLPLLPNEPMGPWDALNPQKIGLLVILIAAIGFAGYVAVRILGARKGFVLTGLLGGLVSSTAVTLAMAARAKEHPAFAAVCATAILLASGIMFPRVAIDVIAVDASLLGSLLVPLSVAGGTVLLGAAALYIAQRRGEAPGKPEREIQIDNPFSLKGALKFGAIFVAVILASKAASWWLADTGVYLSAFAAGLADVDAIALSIAGLHGQGSIGREVAVNGILLAAATNTVSKAGLAAVLGGRRLGWRVAAVLGAAVAAGGLTHLLTI